MRRLLTTLTLTTLVTGLLAGPVQAQTPAPAIAPAAAAVAAAPLTNLAHLNFLADRVAVTPSAAHSSYALDRDPKVGVLWVYADSRPGGQFARVGGGSYDAAANTWGQGAFDSDDIARSIVVYLRQWQATGSAEAKQYAYDQLRGLAYFQTLTGAHAGEMVLWMQPDGSLNLTPTPPDDPNPADTGPSYWLARSLWAFGSGYAAFKSADPAFAAFLAARMDLAVAALNRDVLTRAGSYQIIHGVKVPNWLIVNGADASSEALLGLADYVRTAPPAKATAARTALAQLAAGVAQMGAGTTTAWPNRALLPWALSRSDWHAWGAQMASGLAAAAGALNDRSLLAPAVADTAGFTPQLLTSTGPVNGLLPTPSDRTQIAYGIDARVQALATVGTAAASSGLRDLAGIAAGWYFGANAAKVPVYDPATGVTNDGVEAEGRVNPNSGAESTIHGLLSMQVLDADPRLAELARSSSTIVTRDGLAVTEAETGTLAGNATVTTPASAWTGESLFSGGKYVAAGAGSTVTWTLPAGSQTRLVQPVVELRNGSAARTTFTVTDAAGTRSATLAYGAVGAQGNAPSAGYLIPADLGLRAFGGPVTITATTTGGTGVIDAMEVMPEVATLRSTGAGHTTTVLSSKAGAPALRVVSPAGRRGAPAGTLTGYDGNGRQLYAARTRGVAVATVAPGGFTVFVG